MLLQSILGLSTIRVGQKVFVVAINISPIDNKGGSKSIFLLQSILALLTIRVGPKFAAIQTATQLEMFKQHKYPGGGGGGSSNTK